MSDRIIVADGAVSAANPDAQVVFIVNPQQVLRLRAAGIDAIVSGYIPAGSVGAVDTSAVATIVSAPAFAISSDAALHMDSSPSALSASGSPNTVSAPMCSLYQQDLLPRLCGCG